MKKRFFFPAFFGLCALSFGQTPKLNFFHVYDGTTEFTSRGSIDKNEGECLQMVSAKHFGCFGAIKSVTFVLQDEDASTQENFWVVFRKADSTGTKPDMTSSGVILMQGPYKPPKGSGRAAWQYTVPLSKPLKLLACCKGSNFFYGLRISANANWYNDGLSMWVSGIQGNCAEHGFKVANPHHAWNILYQNGQPNTVVECTGNRAWDIMLNMDKSVLQPIGAIANDPCKNYWPSYVSNSAYLGQGYIGLWPDTTKKVYVGWRLREGNVKDPNKAFAFIILGPGVMSTPFYLFPAGYWCVKSDWLAPVIFPKWNSTPKYPGYANSLLIQTGLVVKGWDLYAQGVIIDFADNNKIYFSNWCYMDL